MSYEIGSNFYTLDSAALADGKPASAHTLRTMARSANYLGSSPRNLVQLSPDNWGADGIAPFQVPTRFRERNLLTVPLLKPAHATTGLVEITHTYSSNDLFLYVETSRGRYEGEVQTGSNVVTSIEVEYRTGRTDFMRLIMGRAPTYAGAASYGSPTSGDWYTLKVLANPRYVQDIDATWTTLSPNYATTGHLLDFVDGSDNVLQSYDIVAVDTANTLLLSQNVPFVDVSGTIRPAFPNSTWRIVQAHTISIEGIAVFST